MLLFKQKLVIIDVSQSVEHDHPHALEFLRMDIGNVTRFFKEKGASVFGMKHLFEVNIFSIINNSSGSVMVNGDLRSIAKNQ